MSQSAMVACELMRAAQRGQASQQVDSLPLINIQSRTIIVNVRLSDMANSVSSEVLPASSVPNRACAVSCVALRDAQARSAVDAARRAEDARFRAFVEHAQDIVSLLDDRGTLLYASPAVRHILGYSADELVGRHVIDLVHPEEDQAILATFRALCTTPGARTEVSYRCRHQDGTWRILESRAWNLLHEPTVRGVVLNSRDMTRKTLALNAIRDSEERFRALSASSPVGIFQSDNEGRLTYVNPQLQAIFGMSEAEMLGKGWLAQVHPEDLPLLEGGWLTALSAQMEYQVDYRLRLPGGVLRHVRGSCAPLRDAAGQVIGSVGTVWDVTERKLLEQELLIRAHQDPLTGLDNRTRFRERLQELLAQEYSDSDAVAVLFIDLDDFKTVNDSLGHGVGDRLLTLVARRLQQSVRMADSVARLGGDEFAVLLSRLLGLDDATALGERIVSSLAFPFVVDGRPIHIGASVGLALAFPGSTTDELLRNADLAMYRAKAGGKRRVVAFTPEMHAAACERLTLHDALYQAVQDGSQFLLHYQPIVELGTRRIVGAEALVRWQHPERGLVSPAVFIPIAEETGLIAELGRWVLNTACNAAARWPCAVGFAPLLTVNVSASQLQDRTFVEDVRGALAVSGLPATALVIEITESTLMHDRQLMLDRLQALKTLGLRVAVDDFGTGFSSLAYLQRYPIDVLKIDKSFVDPVALGPKDEVVARTVIALADSLSLRSVAEGVEHAEQEAKLQALGCRFGQGYLFARPMPEDALQALLEASAPACRP